MKFILMLAICFCTSLSQATLSLPTGLTNGEQLLIMQPLVFGTSFHPVNDPYPMGNRGGFEFGISGHSIPTGNIGYYGNQTLINNSTAYPMLSFGKGIYESMDLLFSFLPFNEATGISSYTGGARWTFFQPTFVPASFSFLFHAGSTNLNNLIFSETLGADLIVGVNVDVFSFFVGGGPIYGQGTFSSTLTQNGLKSVQTSWAFHSIIGVNVAINRFFLAGEVDTYNTTITSLKIGARL